jgi:hypothetical protein
MAGMTLHSLMLQTLEGIKHLINTQKGSKNISLSRQVTDTSSETEKRRPISLRLFFN